MEVSPLSVIGPLQAREWRWPDHILPLSAERRPFQGYSDDAIRGYFRFLSEYPEAYGRLGRFVRVQLGTAQLCPARFVFREAHIDISEADGLLADFLLTKGFEADHFLTLNPPEYSKCFTARFEIPLNSVDRSRAIARYLLKAMREIEEKVREKGGRFAYSEIECYTDRDKRIFPFSSISLSGLKSFPFGGDHFRTILDYPKKWDIHVKIPTADKGFGFEDAGSSLMLKLRQLFLDAGFYEIRSLSGNAIYTLQMISGREAKGAFVTLTNWAAKFGGITSIEMEACTRFWRFEGDVQGSRFIAPVPKVVSVRATY